MHKSKFIYLLVIIFGLFLSACASTTNNNYYKQENNTALENSYQYNDTIWFAIGNDLSFPDETPQNAQIRKQIRIYANSLRVIRNMAEQARPYLYYILQEIKKRDLPVELALLPMIESAYNPMAISRTGASGLWQLMPGTASGFGLKINWWYDGRRDIIASTGAALNYLTYLNRLFGGDWLLAFAAYNSGEGTVYSAINENKKQNLPTDFWHLKLPTQTQDYVPKLLALATIIKYSEQYPITLPYVANAPYLTAIDIGAQLDLECAAKMANISFNELADLNPGYNRWATDPDGPNFLVLPVEKVNIFLRNLSKLPKNERVKWARHTVKSKESLIKIAQYYHTDAKILEKINHLKNSNIYINQVVLIPIATHGLSSALYNTQRRYAALKNIPEVKPVNYIVQKRDTIDRIARKYNVSVKDIKFWNGLKAKFILKRNDELTIWPKKPKIYYRRSSTLYVVKRHDSLSSIAKKYRISLSKLRQDNRLKNNNIIIGQKIFIFKTFVYTGNNNQSAGKQAQHKDLIYYTKPGDTIYKIARKFHKTVNYILQKNHLKKSNFLWAKQKIVI